MNERRTDGWTDRRDSQNSDVDCLVVADPNDLKNFKNFVVLGSKI